MSKKTKNTGTKTKGKVSGKSKTLYIATGIVILIPILLLAYIYFGAKENSGKPVVGTRFKNALDPAISEEEISKVKDALSFDGIDNIEINLKSATLRIIIDTSDDISEDALDTMLDTAYEKVDEILPVKTYFSNKDDGTKMYDLDIHVYNFIPDDTHSDDDQIYKERVKNASNKKVVTDTISSPRNKDVAEDLLKGQEEANKK